MSKQKAIALLLTLSILSLVLAIVVSITNKSSQELVLIKNDTNSFRIEREAIVVIRALTTALKTVGANNIFYASKLQFSNIPAFSLVPDWSDILISDISISPLDQKFNINRESYNFVSDTSLNQLIIFRNLINQIATQNKTILNQNDVNNFIGQLADFIDRDNQITSNNFLQGAENYPTALPSYNVKNAKLDSLTELYLLPAFSRLDLTQNLKTIFDLPFRIIDNIDPVNQCDIGPLNVNMLPPNLDESKKFIEDYIASVENVTLEKCGYRDLFQNRFRLADLISTTIAGSTAPVFKDPLSGDKTWEDLINKIGSGQLKAKLVGLFSHRSDNVEVRFTLSSDGIKVPYVVQFSLSYPNQNTDLPNNISVAYWGHNL